MVDAQLSDFHLGLSPHFTADPHTGWDPMFMSLIFGCDLTIEASRKSLGYDKTQQFTQSSNSPNKDIATRVLKQMGHGEFWDQWPACGGRVVDNKEYTENMKKLSHRIMMQFRAMRRGVDEARPKLLETLRRLVEPEDDWEKRLNDMWTAAAEEMHRELPLEEWGLDFDCSSMPQMPMADFDWAKDNYERADLWQRGIFISPRMFFKEDKSNSGEHRQRTARAACIAPSINMLTVSNPSKLLAIITDRCEFPPGSDCFRRDYLSTHIGRTSRLLVGLFCGDTSVKLYDFHMCDANIDEIVTATVNNPFRNDKGVELIHGFPNIGLACAMHNEEDTSWEDAMVQRAKDPSRLRVTKRADQKGSSLKTLLRHLRYGSGEAHVTLVSQCLIYGFLEKVVEMVRGEVQPSKDVDKSSVGPSPGKSSEGLNRQHTLYKTAENANAIRQPGKSDLLLSGGLCPERWATMASDQFHRALDDIKQLWNDADTFWKEFQLELDHHYCWLPEDRSLSRYVKSKTRLTEERGYRWDVYYDVVGGLMRRHLRNVLMWKDMTTFFERIALVGERFIRVDLCRRFAKIIQAWIVQYLGDLTRRGIFASAPPSREHKLFKRSTPMEDMVTEHDDKLKKTSLGFPRLQVEKPGNWSVPLSEDEQEAIKAMHDLLGNPVAVNLFSLKTVVKHICQLMSKPDASALFTSHVRGTVETVALLLDLHERMDPHMHDFQEGTMVFRTVWGEPGGEMDELMNLRPSAFVDYMFYEVCAIRKARDTNEESLGERAPSPESYHGPHVLYSLYIDEMDFEEDQTLAFKHCMRMYDWIDQKMGVHEQANLAPQPTHSDAEAMAELRQVCFLILDAKCDDIGIRTQQIVNALGGKSSISLKDSVVMQDLMYDLAQGMAADRGNYDEDAWIVEAPKQPRQIREERLQNRRDKKKDAGKRRQKKKNARAASAAETTAGSPAEALPTKAPSPPKTPSPTGTLSLPKSSPHSAGFYERKRKFEEALDRPPLDTGFAPPPPDEDERIEAQKRQKTDDEEEEEGLEAETPVTAQEATLEDASHLDEGLAKLRLASSKNPKNKDKIKLPQKYWATLRTLYSPGPRGSLASKDLEVAFNRLGYCSEHLQGSLVKIVMDPERCPWERKDITLMNGEKADNTMVQYHNRHGGMHGKDSMLDNALLKKVKKRFEERGITLKLIQKWFSE